ncbi:MAG: hypothetical protein F6K55_09020 [Moorea sp. SIO4A3]|nr:hypothetical protein [Moorena sp. SIO4A3]
MRIDRLGEWNLAFMPAQMSLRVSSSYQPSGATGVMQNQIFQSHSEELSIPSLNIAVKNYRKGLTDYVNEFLALSRPYPGYNSPLVLRFIWGEELFSPCVMTEAQVISKDWYPNGEKAEVTISMTLRRVPYDQVIEVPDI